MKNTRISISRVAYDDQCRRKPIMELLLNLNRIHKTFSETTAIITGKILHEILQSTFTFDFPLIEYYFYRKNHSKAEAIYKAMKELENRWLRIIEENNEKYIWYHDYDMQGKIKENLAAEIPIIAELSSTLLSFKNNGDLSSDLIGTEFHINLEIIEGVSLIGKIDILAWGKDKKTLRVIELKTGGKYSTNESQVLTYTEIVEMNHPNFKVKPEIWYSKNNKRCRINYPDQLSYGNEIERIRVLTQKALNIKNEDELPPMSNNSWFCSNICKICLDHMDELFPIKIKSKKKPSLDDFFS